MFSAGFAHVTQHYISLPRLIKHRQPPTCSILSKRSAHASSPSLQQTHRTVLFSMLSMETHHICGTLPMSPCMSGSLPLSWATPFLPPWNWPPSHPPDRPAPPNTFHHAHMPPRPNGYGLLPCLRTTVAHSWPSFASAAARLHACFEKLPHPGKMGYIAVFGQIWEPKKPTRGLYKI